MDGAVCRPAGLAFVDAFVGTPRTAPRATSRVNAGHAAPSLPQRAASAFRRHARARRAPQDAPADESPLVLTPSFKLDDLPVVVTKAGGRLAAGRAGPAAGRRREAAGAIRAPGAPAPRAPRSHGKGANPIALAATTPAPPRPSSLAGADSGVSGLDGVNPRPRAATRALARRPRRAGPAHRAVHGRRGTRARAVHPGPPQVRERQTELAATLGARRARRVGAAANVTAAVDDDDAPWPRSPSCSSTVRVPQPTRSARRARRRGRRRPRRRRPAPACSRAAAAAAAATASTARSRPMGGRRAPARARPRAGARARVRSRGSCGPRGAPTMVSANLRPGRHAKRDEAAASRWPT